MADPIFSIEYDDKAVQDRIRKLAAKTKSAGSLSVKIGTNVGYMADHQLGINGQVQRRFLGVGKKDRQEIIAILEENLLDETATLRTAFQEIGEYMVLSTDQNFENETDPDGAAWAPNNPFYAAQKVKSGNIGKILQRTGRGRASIAYQVQGG